MMHVPWPFRTYLLVVSTEGRYKGCVTDCYVPAPLFITIDHGNWALRPFQSNVPVPAEVIIFSQYNLEN